MPLKRKLRRKNLVKMILRYYISVSKDIYACLDYAASLAEE